MSAMSSREQEKELALLLSQTKPGWQVKGRLMLKDIKYPALLKNVAVEMLATGKGSSVGRAILKSFNSK